MVAGRRNSTSSTCPPSPRSISEVAPCIAQHVSRRSRHLLHSQCHLCLGIQSASFAGRRTRRECDHTDFAWN